MFPRHIFPCLRAPVSQLRKASFILFSSLSAATLPTYLILNSESLPSPNTPHEQPLKALVRSYIVYSLCSIPSLVDNSPKLLDALAEVPGLKQLAYGFVRITFFNQFVGGETASATLPLLRALRSDNKGALFSYSVEVDEREGQGSSASDNSLNGKCGGPPHKRIVREILNCIDVAADFEDSVRGASKALLPYHSTIATAGPYGTHPPQFQDASSSYHISDKGRRTWVAIKLTAMLPNAHALINFSKYITSVRENTKPARHTAVDTSVLTYDRLQDISRGKEHMPIEFIPFPGCPTLGDMDIIVNSAQTFNVGIDSSFSTEDIHVINDLYHDLLKICVRAQERGVKVIFDAEYSWYQPALDALVHSLMRQFNALPSSTFKPNPLHPQVQPLIYTTYQAYLRRTPLHLAYTLQDARRNNYALGVKLVRGAYHPYEISAHASAAAQVSSDHKNVSLSISPDPLPPVWLTKSDTDKAYNQCVELVVAAVKDDIDNDVLHSSVKGKVENIAAPLHIPSTKLWVSDFFGWFRSDVSVPFNDDRFASDPTHRRPGQVGVGVLFGTHNWDSCNILLDQLIEVGLGKLVTTINKDSGKKVELSDAVTERVAIGQLYGMCDDLTDSIVSHTLSSVPLAIKYVPYGGLTEVLPYLSRRAFENKSVLNDGGAVRERQRAGREIWKKVKGWVGIDVTTD